MERVMERVLTKAVKAGVFWVSKKAKEEISSITQDLNNTLSAVEEKAKWIFNKLKGKPFKPLPDLLKEYNLPPGIFPRNVKCYKFDETKRELMLYLNSPCEVRFRDSSILRYATQVKARLSRGKLSAVEGMKMKFLIWVKVSSVNAGGYKSKKVWFGTIAGIKKSRSKDVYDMPRHGVTVSEF